MDQRAVAAKQHRTPSRRDWLRWTLGGSLGYALGNPTDLSAQDPAAGKGTSEGPKDADLEQLRTRLEDARIGPLHTARSKHYLGIGDAAEAFIKVILRDCEQLAADYLQHFRSREFEVRMPEHRLTVVLLRDERSFGKFLQLRAPAEPAGGGAVLRPTGVYDRKTNILQVFDWRNVPMSPRSAARNSETLAHEGIHQLTFNSGLLNRQGDIPLCFVEGMGTYGEPRLPIGPGDLGRRNLKRLDDLAKIQRQIPWIPLTELITDDTVLRSGKAGRVLLAYAQSWLLVHYLMKSPAGVPKLRSYLKTIASRTNADHRLEDTRTHFGDLDALDRELRRYSVRLLTTA